MIYTVSEWLATISESLIIFFFLVKILSYKTMARSKKIIGTVVFCCLQCTSSLILDQFFVFEGLYVIITIFIYLLFCWIMLEKPIWFQTIVVLLVFACLFTINIDCRFNIAKFLIRCAVFAKPYSYLAFIYYKGHTGFCIDHSY